VLTACTLLQDDEARARYRHWRSWLDDRATDESHPVTALQLFRECRSDLRIEIRAILGLADASAACYHLIDQPMQGLLFWALPAGVVAGVVSVAVTGNASLALSVALPVGAGTWVLYIGHRLRQRINEVGEPSATPAPGDPGRLATVPNLVSATRLLFGPPLIIWGTLAHQLSLVAVVLAACLATDWLDGFVARRWNQISDVGKALDRGADRLVTLSLAASLLLTGVGPPALLMLAILRDVALSSSSARQTLSRRQTAPVTWAGKAGFALLITGLLLYLLPEAHLGWMPRDGSLARGCHLVASAIAWWGLSLRYLAAVQYLWPLVADRRLRAATS
jgi:cardiolipin synthase